MTAKQLRALHVAGRPLVLPNAWDAGTAKLVEAADFPAVATSSVAVAESLGYRDGEHAPVDAMFAAASRIAGAISVPLTVDAEAGYELSAAEFAERLIATGAVGCNIEDTDHRDGDLRDCDEHARFVGAIRSAVDNGGKDLVINARIDVFIRHKSAAEIDVLPEAIKRAKNYLAAGADCVYPIHLRDADAIKEFVTAVTPAPVNVTYLPGGPSIDRLAELGVARVSLGGGLWKLTQSWLAERLAEIGAGQPPY